MKFEANQIAWYTPAVYDKNDNYKYTGKNHIVDDNGRTMCGRIDTNNHLPRTLTYNTGYNGSLNDCVSCARSNEAN